MTDRPPIRLTENPRRKTLAETVAEQLLKAVEGHPAGTRLPTEPELMEQMGVGRSAVREALSGLALLGVIEIRQGQGVFVTDKAAAVAAREEIGSVFNKGVTRDLLEARMAVEVEVARRAAERRTDEDLAALQAVIASHEKAMQEGQRPDEPAANFHLVLAEASHNEVLAGMVRSFFKLMLERVPTTYALDDFAEWEMDQHRSLVAAIEAGDEELAGQRMASHLGEMARYYSRSESVS